jgi:hypothetical protein
MGHNLASGSAQEAGASKGAGFSPYAHRGFRRSALSAVAMGPPASPPPGAKTQSFVDFDLRAEARTLHAEAPTLYANGSQSTGSQSEPACRIHRLGIRTRSNANLQGPQRSAEASGSFTSRDFHDLRAKSMTKNERAQAAIPHQDTRNLSCHARFSSPRGEVNEQNRREFARTRRIRHGVARAIENLRGLRLSLVPYPGPRERVLLPL